MTVWIVSVIHYDEYGEIHGIYSTEAKARAVQEELINQNAADVLYMQCDPIDVRLEEWEVE